MNIYPLGGSLTYPILIASVLFGLLIWGTLCDKKLSGAKKWILFSLRAVTILLLFWILLRPSAVTTTIARDASSVIVLLDETRSMSVPDANDAKQSRFDAAKAVLTSNQDAVNSLKKELDLKFYSFDSGIRPVTSPDGKTLAFSDQPMGEQTALGKVLDDLIRQEAGKRILGVFLLTDGAQRLPAQNASQELAALPQTAAHPIARMRLADLGRHRKAQAVFLPAVLPAVEDHGRPHRALSLCVEPAKDPIFLEGDGILHDEQLLLCRARIDAESPQGRWKAAFPALCFLFMRLPLASVGQADAALGAATGQDLAAIPGRHTLAEPVLLGALTLLGLIGTDHT